MVFRPAFFRHAVFGFSARIIVQVLDTDRLDRKNKIGLGSEPRKGLANAPTAPSAKASRGSPNCLVRLRALGESGPLVTGIARSAAPSMLCGDDFLQAVRIACDDTEGNTRILFQIGVRKLNILDRIEFMHQLPAFLQQTKRAALARASHRPAEETLRTDLLLEAERF